jgi:hypothetical protein
MGLKAEPLSLQGDRASAAEGIENRRRVSTSGLLDLASRLAHNLLVVYVLPLDEILDDLEEPLSLLFLLLFGGKLVWVAGGIVDEGGEEDRPAGG